MDLFEDGGEVRLGPTLFRFEPLPAESSYRNERGNRERTLKAHAAAMKRRKIKTVLPRELASTSEDLERRAIRYARWLAERDGVEISPYDEPKAHIGYAPRTAGTYERNNGLVKAVEYVSFGETRIDIPGWDHGAFPVAEGPVSWLDYSAFAERIRLKTLRATPLSELRQRAEDAERCAEESERRAKATRSSVVRERESNSASFWRDTAEEAWATFEAERKRRLAVKIVNRRRAAA